MGEKTDNHSLLKYGHDHVQNSCFRALYMEVLLSKGYHFDHWKDIRFVSTIQGKSVGWALGYILEERIPSIFNASNKRHKHKQHNKQKHDNECQNYVVLCVTIGIVVIVLIIFLFLSYVVSVRNCNRENCNITWHFACKYFRTGMSKVRGTNAENEPIMSNNAVQTPGNVQQEND